MEDLLATLVTERRSGTAPDAPNSLSNGASSSKASPEDDVIRSDAAKNNTPISERDSQEEATRDFGHMQMNDSEIAYVSATHWAAIRDNVRITSKSPFPGSFPRLLSLLID